MKYLITLDDGSYTFYDIVISGDDILDIFAKFKQLYPDGIIVTMQNMKYA